MKLALVTTPWDAPSSVGDFTRALVRELADTTEITPFVERGREGGDYFGWKTRAADELVPRQFDHVLYSLGNEREHAFMAPMLRALGGCVALHAWRLSELAFAAHPELERGGWRGSVRAVREGGLGEARRYRELVRDRQLESCRGELALNRSIVRFGDSFIVPSTELRRAILDDRNAPTPIGVVEPSADWSAIAAQYRELLERFPAPRTARKSLIAVQIAAALRSRGK
jgi:hypothetical protein